MGGRSCCSQAVYTVDDEGFEEDGTVGRSASQFVNHSYSKSGTSRDATQGGGTRREEGDNSDGHGEGEVRLEDERRVIDLKVAGIFIYLFIYWFEKNCRKSVSRA